MRLPLTIKPWRCLHLRADFGGEALKNFIFRLLW